MSEQNAKPTKTFRAGNIEVSIWRNESSKNGQTIVRYSAKVEKQFKDGQDWRKTDYFFPDELPKLQSLLQKAYDFITVKESQDAAEIPV